MEARNTPEYIWSKKSMKTKKVVRALCTLLTIILLFSFVSLPCSALSYRTGANSASQSYKDSVYYQNLTAIPLTGDNRTDVLAVALSQLGYQEGNSDGQYSGTVSGSNNYTEYNYNMGDWNVGYGGRDYPWCASFVSFCLLQANCHDQTKISDWCRKNTEDKNYIWREVSCSQWATQLRKYGYFEYSKNFDGTYTPIYGDLIFFTSSGEKNKESHIGLVLWSDGSKVYTVEGNTSSGSGLDTNGGGVYFKSYSLTSANISGYGVLPYKSDESVRKIDYTGANITPGLYVAASSNKYVYADATDTNYTYLLPRHSVFEVTEIVNEGLVKANCTINGQTVTGYIKNNSDRIIQLTATDAYINTTPDTPENTPNTPSDTPDTPSDTPDTPSNPPARLDPPKILSYTLGSLTLEPAQDYEFRIDDGNWQPSNVFSDLEKDKTYLLYQRKAGDTGSESEALEVCIEELLQTRRLSHLLIEGCELSPKFDPTVLKYTLSVPYAVNELKITALGADTSKIDISEYAFDENGKATILITVTPEIGAPREYTILCERQAPIVESTETDAPPRVTDAAAPEVGCEAKLSIGSLTCVTLLPFLGCLLIRKKRDV